MVDTCQHGWGTRDSLLLLTLLSGWLYSVP
jgi:hypothetical protein